MRFAIEGGRNHASQETTKIVDVTAVVGAYIQAQAEGVRLGFSGVFKNPDRDIVLQSTIDIQAGQAVGDTGTGRKAAGHGGINPDRFEDEREAHGNPDGHDHGHVGGGLRGEIKGSASLDIGACYHELDAEHIAVLPEGHVAGRSPVAGHTVKFVDGRAASSYAKILENVVGRYKLVVHQLGQNVLTLLGWRSGDRVVDNQLRGHLAGDKTCKSSLLLQHLDKQGLVWRHDTAIARDNAAWETRRFDQGIHVEGPEDTRYILGAVADRHQEGRHGPSGRT